MLKKGAIEIYQGDCLEVMPTLNHKDIALVLTDLPYGVLNKTNPNAKWDAVIPMERLWEEWDRICKPDVAYILFGSGMFTAHLMMSNPSMWRYNLIWDKQRTTGFLNSKKMPLRCHEDICVFYKKLPTYNVQMEELNGREPTHKVGQRGKFTNNQLGKYRMLSDGESPEYDKKFPRSILSFPKPHNKGNHPTEKSVELCRWLIRAYTNPGDVVMDSTMGRGTTGVAAVLEGRGFIGIEKESKYYDSARERITRAMETPKQGDLFGVSERMGKN